MKNILTRRIAMFLAVMMFVTSIPFTSAAEDAENTSVIEQETVEQENVEQEPAEQKKEEQEPAAQKAEEVEEQETSNTDTVQKRNTQIFDFGTEGAALPVNKDSESETYTSIIGTGALVIEFTDTFKTLNVTGDMNVGDLTIKGNGTVNVDGKVTVTGDEITVKDATVKGASYFGFADDTSGNKTMTTDNAVFDNVGTIGVNKENTSVVLSVDGIYVLTNNSVFVYDYSLNYKDTDGQELTPEDGWTTTYRAIDKGNEKKFIISGAESDSLQLPEVDSIAGWSKTEDGTTAVSVLETSDIGNVHTLYAVEKEVVSQSVDVEWSLEYTPNQYTNDDADPALTWSPETQSIGAKLTLPDEEVFRFGYEFKGWQVVVDGKDKGEPVKGNITITSDLLTEGEGNPTLVLKAVWKAKEIPLKLQIIPPDRTYEMNDILFKAEGDTDWLRFDQFVQNHGGTLGGNNDMQFANAVYDTTLDEYLNRILPNLQIKTGDNGWTVSAWQFNQIQYSNQSIIAMGENSIFGMNVPTGYTLKSYEAALYGNLLTTLTTDWSELIQEIEFSDKKVWNANNLWTIYVNGVDRTAEIQNATNTTPSVLSNVPINADVTFKVLSSSADANAAFSLWKISSGVDRLKVKETTEGDYRCYTFTMPVGKVNATLSNTTESVIFNIKESPVSEQKIGNAYGVWTNERIDHLTPRYDRTGGNLGYAPNSELEDIDLADGWSNGAVLYNEMNYFYELPLTRAYYLTTYDANQDQMSTIEEENGTWNQWRGGHRENIYLKDCHLWATTYYTEEANLQERIPDAEERKYFDGKLDKMANLYFYLQDGISLKDNYKQYFEGDNNIIGCIATENYGQDVQFQNSTNKEVRIGSRIANNPVQGWGHINSGNFYPYAHTTYKDNLGYWMMGVYGPGGYTWSGTNINLPHKMLSATSQIHLRSGFFHLRSGNWGPVYADATLILEEDLTNSQDIKGTVVVRGNLLYTGNLTVEGTLIVLGDMIRTQKLYVKSNSTVIANMIEVHGLDCAGTILTNGIRNYSGAIANSGFLAATANGDNTGYTGYVYQDIYINEDRVYVDNTNNANIAYRFTGGNVYLLGYQTSSTSGTSLLTDEKNPLHYYADQLPEQKKDESGYPILNYDKYIEVIAEMKAELQTKGMELYEANKAVNADEECFYLGNSASDKRKFLFSGANLYITGRMTLNNGATVSGGKICASTLSSKWDLIISGGTIEANEVGNAAAVQVTKLDGTKRYAKTEITGGSIKADRIGALSESTANENRSSLLSLSTDSISTYTEGGKIQLVHDALVYYSIDTTKFAAPEAKNFSLRVIADYEEGKNLEEQSWDLIEPEQPGNFATLSYAEGYSGTGEAKWSLSQAEGIFVTAYDENGKLRNEEEVTASIAARDSLVLYAIEVSKITLSVFQDGDYISQITAAGNAVDKVENSQSGFNSEYAVLSGAAVEVTIDPSMKDKVLFLYRDDKDIIHNLFPTVSDDGRKITFNMPFRACELYVTSRFTLYLNNYNIVFQSGTPGFRTELISENADRAFDYTGDVYITRNDGRTDLLSNTIQFEDNFDNSSGRKIILHNLCLKMKTGSKVNITLDIDGTDGKTVYFKGGERTNYFDGALTFRGLNGKETDVFKQDSYTFHGGMDKFAFEDLHVQAGALIYPNSYNGKLGHFKDAVFTNCKLDITGVINYNCSGGNLNFTNCEINFTGGGCLGNASANFVLTNCILNSGTATLMNGGNLTLDGTTVINHATPTETQLNEAMRITSLILKNDSKFYSSNSILAPTITLTDNSELYGGYDPATKDSTGRLSGYDFTVEDGAKVYAKYVLCAGARDCFSNTWQRLTNGNDYSGIIVDGGSIYATEFIGSDYNSKITVKSGHVEAKYIGTYGKIFNVGIINSSRPLHHPDKSPVQNSTIKIQDNSTVKILDGGHLGGGISTITIDNASVEGALADILGESITISGADTKVHADDIIAVKDLTIKDADGDYYANGYKQSDRNNDRVAVFVENELRAHAILIDAGALVYAKNAYCSVLEGEGVSSLAVIPDSGAELYTVNYGYLGDGEYRPNFVADNKEGNKNIWGIVAIAVDYDFGEMFGESEDLIQEVVDEGKEKNPDYFIYQADTIIELNELSHPYLQFVGWVDVQGKTASSINQGLIPNDSVVRRVAKWEPKPIQFKVVMDSALLAEGENIFDEAGEGKGTLEDDGIFTWEKTIDAAYLDTLWGSKIESENMFKKEDYLLHTHSITTRAVYTANGETKISGEKVNHAMIDAYADGTNGPLVIRIESISKTALVMTFDLNIKDGKPTTAKFANLGKETSYQIRANMGTIFNTAENAGVVDDLTDVTATGYDFLGWSTDKNTSPENFTNELNVNGTVGTDVDATAWYAVWKAKEYQVRFYASPMDPAGGTYYQDKSGSDNIPDDTAVGETANTLDEIIGKGLYTDLTLIYDEPLSDTGHIVPTVWRESWVFDSWYYEDEVENADKHVKDSELFNAENKNLTNVDFGVESIEGEPVIYFYAEYDPLKVEYKLDDGKWNGNSLEDTQEYPEAKSPLRAYVERENEPPRGTEYVSGDGNSQYSAISTTGAYYDEHESLVTGDYRDILGKQGYTFAGWYSNSECTKPIEVTPKFSLTHITVYAKWTANEYKVTLNAAHNSYESGTGFTLKTGEDTYVDNKDAKVSVDLTVGEYINDANWPDRDLWGTRQKDETAKPRPLWGFVFTPMDPWYPGADGTIVSDNYKKYNEDIAALYKSGKLFVKNTSRFALPEQDVNGKDLPDYPNGSSLNMYATYNNYAIIFMQYYMNKDGEVTQRVIETVQHGAIDQYTLEKLKELEVELPGTGYTPLGWYVNSTTMNNDRVYKVEDFTDSAKLQEYQNEAVGNTYDIIVYHIYAADEHKDGVKFTSDPYAQVKTDETDAVRIQEITIPQNMQPGTLWYSFKNSDYSENYAHTDTSTGAVTRDYTVKPYEKDLSFADAISHYEFADALKKAGLKLEVFRGEERIGEIDLTGSKSQNNGSTDANVGATGIEVRPNDRLVLTLNHSYVIEEIQNTVFDLAFSFKVQNDESETVIPGQQLLLNDVNLSLVPSQYDVVFHANSDGKTVKDKGSFNLPDGDTVEKKGTASEAFGYIKEMPTFVGYTHKIEESAQAGSQRWTQESAVVTVDGSRIVITGTPSYDPEGKLHLYAQWDPNQHKFLAEDPVLAQWTVEYKDGNDEWSRLTASTETKLPYGTEIRFTPIIEKNPIPAYMKLDIDGFEPLRLDMDIEKESEGYYNYVMPDADVTAQYSEVLDLFLDNGNIILTPDKVYQDKKEQNKGWYTWTGDYLIRQNINDDTKTATKNTLTVNGDMSSKNIGLGLLNISAQDSITLDKYPDKYQTTDAAQSAIGENVTLTLTGSQVNASNIRVPEDASLTITAENSANHLTLEPLSNVSAIGQKDEASNSKIILKDCSIEVKETGEYVGTWFGGKDTSSVELSNVTLSQPPADNRGTGRYVTYADNVTITNCNLGTQTQQIAEPIYAKNSLTINGGTLYMLSLAPQGKVSMIGTDSSGTIEVNDAATVSIEYDGGNRSDRPFTGTMKLNSQTANVVIDGMLVLDTTYGNITVDEAGAVQGSKTTSHSRYYLILQEFDDEATDVTVGADKTMTFVQPKEGEFKVGTFTVNADTKIQTQPNAAENACTLNFNKVNIGAEATVEASLSDGDTIKTVEGTFTEAEGSYSQSNGKLKSDSAIEGHKMDMVLEGVAVTANNLITKNLTLKNSTVNCAGGKVGSAGVENGLTTVHLSEETTITADTIGALGEKAKTFTQVIADDPEVRVVGTLIRDIYRIDYKLQDIYKHHEATEYVLRTVDENLDGTTAVPKPEGKVPVYKPTVSESKADKFVTWYIMDGTNNKISLFLKELFDEKYHEKFNAFQEGLSEQDAQYAAADENGIPTVYVYAFYSISGKALFKEGENYLEGDFSDGVFDGLNAASDRGWSALLTIEAEREEDEDYAVSFDTKLPGGTKLILAWLDREGGKPMYYSYTADFFTGEKVTFSEFTALGAENKLALGASDNLSEQFILTVDYTDAGVTNDLSHTVSFSYKAAGQSSFEELCQATVAVRAADESGRVTVSNDKAIISLPNNSYYEGKTYAVVAETTNTTRLPYTAEPKLGDHQGTLIGGNKILFIIDAFSQNNLSDEFNISGLPQGYAYEWSVVLLKPDTIIDYTGEGILDPWQVNAWKKMK